MADSQKLFTKSTSSTTSNRLHNKLASVHVLTTSSLFALLLLTLLLQPSDISCAPSATPQDSIMQRSGVPVIQDWKGFKQHLSSFITKGDQVAILLDYDGTLAPLADHPNQTVMEPVSQAVLERLVHHPNVFLAFISGRGADNVQAKIGLPNVTYAGNHGLEIHYANGTQWRYEIPDGVRANYTRLVEQLGALATDGAWVENKTSSLTFHYRDVAEEKRPALHARAEAVIRSLNFVANAAHCAVEAKPPVRWNKGEAALHILREQFGQLWAGKVKAVFAGDDTTDEDAMRALQGVGRTFRVSALPSVQTYADFRLPSTETVAELLQWIEGAL